MHWSISFFFFREEEGRKSNFPNSFSFLAFSDIAHTFQGTATQGTRAPLQPVGNPDTRQGKDTVYGVLESTARAFLG